MTKKKATKKKATKKRVVKQQGKNKKLPATGFHTNPERINKKGAPEKEWTWRQLIKDYLGTKDDDGYEYRESVVAALIEKARKGDVQAIKEIGDRVDGKPPMSSGRYGEDGEFEKQDLVVVYGKDD